MGQTKPVEITSEPGHHLALSNAYTRVFQVQVPPHASTQMHLHRHSYLFVNLGGRRRSRMRYKAKRR